jgi:hypothetical protein
MQGVDRTATVAPPLHGPTQMRCRVTAAVHPHPRCLDHVDRSRHRREYGFVGRQEFCEPCITGLRCKRT